ncbi:DUF3870 domain-containing protein [Neomoorella mulderi]|uniref:DUF3870 domain-containing protein n=1 Tax=Neomoorella mulderi TaxID=202604 RepID=UPI0007828691|nr:DUF3870 domain-containing protein [Moorella mulderi]
MKSFSKETWYITGHAQPPSDIPAYQLYKMVVIGLEVEPETGQIVDAYCTLATPIARRVVKSVLIGRKLLEELNIMIEEIEKRFHGSSQRAVIYALKDAAKKFTSIKGM